MLRTQSSNRLVCLRAAGLLAALLCCLPLAHTQALPSATRGPASFWAGAGFANYSASFPYQSGSRLSGVTAFAEYHRDARLGIGGRVSFLNFGGFEHETERSFLAGPQFRFFRRDRIQPFADGFAGVGTIHYPYSIGTESYFTIAPGGGLDYILRRRFSLRGEYEYQFWVNSPGYANEPGHSLHPNGLQLGISYRFFR